MLPEECQDAFEPYNLALGVSSIFVVTFVSALGFLAPAMLRSAMQGQRVQLAIIGEARPGVGDGRMHQRCVFLNDRRLPCFLPPLATGGAGHCFSCVGGRDRRAACGGTGTHPRRRARVPVEPVPATEVRGSLHALLPHGSEYDRPRRRLRAVPDDSCSSSCSRLSARARVRIRCF